ncbi:antibiotic biosynthesis monooxygenase [Subsaximicrobium wynnwilliamsii]|jgi:quinol monooxygenase YgiN|uniref:Antibiotic biosynthesis monooxygenase n=1 Tax=Subsaximicrobium wynnwilliamsii TaxID=291179 RepID=A0A5C6ZI23_9FLAO|nr:antibiotic biosynthesis monooxygenase [Subsaximicrobium wynnwilliamsii]TXD84066.1 antibiotic biosynthesis monooxygenase [Subsaximicrobium wynnwilliamsii]TXD88976.1 antibiotic biosynthesis monooxygenase [Subsaximicrobium wynnwilliamsii]TXE03778.1 antibiotic biosynthesis monooxygenase [Subsaximicrobium wynnwilliamsii]
MLRYGIKVTLKAKKETTAEVEDFIKGAVELAQKEEQTITWYSFKVDAHTFGIFDTFETEEGREAHLNGDIAKALMEHADRLLSEAPVIEKIDILSSK